MRTAAETDSRSTRELFSDLGEQVKTLAQQEVELAKVEMRQNLREVVRDSVMLIVGGVVAWLAVLALCGALAAALTALFALALPLGVAIWLGPLVLALALGVVAAVMVQVGRQRLQKAQLKPAQTQKSLEEDAQWLKNRFN